MTNRSFSIACLPVLVAIIIFSYTGCDFDKREFIETAKSTFAAFYNSNYRTTDSTIDWHVLSINGDEVGRDYMQMTTDYDKLAYRKAIVVRLRTLCTQKGWNPANMKNWRISERGVESASVTADGPKGSIIMTLRKYQAEKRIGTIQIR